MASVSIKNLSRKEALQLLENVQKNHAKSYAIQGKQDCRWINTDTVNATVKPQENQFGDLDYSKNTFVVEIDGDNITMKDIDDIETSSYREEINEQVFFRPIDNQ